MLQIIGVLAIIALVVILFIRPASIVAVVLAVGVVGAAIVVSWNDVERVRAQRASDSSLVQRNAATQPAVRVPPPTPPHSGT
jgi:hypothetical protein